MAYGARSVANLLLDLGDKHGRQLTHMSVHKLIYFAHGWCLSLTGLPLVREPFEAWRRGPVLRTIWDTFRQAGDRVIQGRATVIDPETGEINEARASFTSIETALVEDVLRAYGSFTADELSKMTHRPGGAWAQVWAGKHYVLGMRIPNEAIKLDFQSAQPPSNFHQN